MKPTTKNPNQKARSYQSPILDAFLALSDPAETARTETRMVLAVRIADALKAKGMSKKELATQLKQHPSAVTKWLSGQHNFTADTLTDIGRALEVDFFGHDAKPKNNIIEVAALKIVINTPAAKPNLPREYVSNRIFLNRTETAYS